MTLLWNCGWLWNQAGKRSWSKWRTKAKNSGARTLSNPNLLVLDEATSALDYDTESTVCKNLQEELKGKTVFFITHRLSTVRNANIIILMHNGKIEEMGTHEELMNMQGRYATLYAHQGDV